METIVVVTGSLPPDICGVGDYTGSLVRALAHEGAEIEIFYRKRWPLKAIRQYAELLQHSSANVVNIQYPTEGYGFSIVPQLLCCLLRRKQCFVTLHELTRKSLKGKAAIYLFFLSAKWIVFTADSEREAACRLAPWLRHRSSTIGIGSNIPLQESQMRDIDVAYFGLIRPEKGLETFLSSAEKLILRRPLRIKIIGLTVPGYESYGEAVVARCRDLGIELALGLRNNDVSRELSRLRIALLPFPDGMSARRGSALAAMGNGAIVVTTSGASSSEEFHSICVMADHPESLPDRVEEVLDHALKFEPMRIAGQEYARSRSWQGIAQAYIEVAKGLISSSQSRSRSKRAPQF